MGFSLNPPPCHHPGSAVHGWEAEKDGTVCRKSDVFMHLFFFIFFFLCRAKLRCSRVGLAIWEKYVGRKNAGGEDELPPAPRAGPLPSESGLGLPPQPSLSSFSSNHFHISPCRNYQIFCF